MSRAGDRLPTELADSDNCVDASDAVGRAPAPPWRWRAACSSPAPMVPRSRFRLLSRLRLALAFAALAIGAVTACNTPSVPLPPPLVGPLGFTSAGTGLVVLRGMPEPAHADARFYVFNRNAGDGVIATAGHDGAFATTPFNGVDGDVVAIYYDTPAGDRSEQLCTTLRVGQTLVSIPCAP